MTPRAPSGQFPQLLLDVHEELIVDLFAGGGGASLGIEMATGRQVDVAINHDAAAVALHRANHPQTTHHTCDVFEVDPRAVTKGRPIGLLWASPDCTFHSKARGGKPFRDAARKRRALAWVVTRWAGQVRPRVICLENVEEFAQWGPLVGRAGAERPCPRRRGRTFRRWVSSLERLGYTVEWRELRACDYGAPTIRKRLFVIARCDGRPIVWPDASHGPGARRPYRTAAECIDWSIPMLSIFATRAEARAWGKVHGQATPVRPLAEATMRRIARGVRRFVLENPRPFILRYQSGDRTQPARAAEDPLGTVMAGGARPALVSPFLVPRYGERVGQEPRVRSIEEPSPVVVPTGNGASLVAAHLSTYYGGARGEGRGAELEEPLATQTTENRHALVASFLARHWGGMVGKDLREPLPTVLTKGAQDQIAVAHLMNNNSGHPGGSVDAPAHTITSTQHAALVYSFLQSYYGAENQHSPAEPLRTIPTHDKFGLVTVEVNGEPYVIADIAMRMLQPRELYRAQGFPDSYRIDRGVDGRAFTKTEQVRMVGNSVSPQVAAALVRANAPELRARDEVAA